MYKKYLIVVRSSSASAAAVGHSTPHSYQQTPQQGSRRTPSQQTPPQGSRHRTPQQGNQRDSIHLRMESTSAANRKLVVMKLMALIKFF